MTVPAAPQPEYATGFHSLIDYRLQRSWRAALGFYAAYVVFGVAMGMVLIMIVSAILMPNASSYEQGYSFGVRAGELISILYAIAVLGAVTCKRKAWNNVVYIGSMAASVILAYFIGTLGGLIPTAVLLAIKGPEPEKTAS